MKTILSAIILSIFPFFVSASNTYSYRDDSVVITQSQIATSNTNSTTTFTLGPYQAGSVQCVWASVENSLPATFLLQVSNNESNWDNVSGFSTSTTATSGSSTWMVDPMISRFGTV